MKKRVSAYTKERYKKIIGSLIEGLSKPVEVFKKPVKHECTNCYFDKTTNSSTNMCKWTLPETLQKQQEYIDSGGITIKYKYFSKVSFVNSSFCLESINASLKSLFLTWCVPINFNNFLTLIVEFFY